MNRLYGRIRLFIMILAAALTVAVCVLSNAWEVMAYDEIVIVIDPGHGGGSGDDTHRGALYKETIMEKDVDLITATAMYEELSQYGNLKVYMTRSDDRELSLKERVEYAASVGADYLISVHYNASEHHRFYGAEIFTSAFSQEYAAGYSMASNIMNWWEEDGAVNRGIKVRIGNKGTDYYGIIRIGREHSIPTIILEHGFLDNDIDYNRMPDEASWRRMGELDATAVADYLNVKKGTVSASINREYIVDVPTERVEPDSTDPILSSVTIDAYDADTGMMTYTVTASDPDGRMMYFDIDTEELAVDEVEGFQHLNVWENGASSMQGSYKVPKDYKGGFVARVYNYNNLFTDSEPIMIPNELIPENIELTQVNQGIIGDETGLNSVDDNDDALQTEDDKNKDGTWNLFDALSKTKGNDYDPDNSALRKSSRSNYIGMIVAIAVAILMLAAAIFMGVKTSIDNKKRKNRNKSDRINKSKERW